MDIKRFHNLFTQKSIWAFASITLILMGCVSTTQNNSPAPKPAPKSALETVSIGGCEGVRYEPEELRPVKPIPAEGGELNTALLVKLVERCVPVWNNLGSGTGYWQFKKMNLRTYGYPKSGGADANPDNSDEWVFDSPGPTFVIKKSDQGTTNGTKVNLKLYNRLPNQGSDSECEKYPASEKPEDPDKYPNCFHGNEFTNMHYHGFHISPQAPQDDVSLIINPGKQYQYALDPIPYTQAEGTHWYHAHKHGSTSLQILNGMVGTFVIKGKFDKQIADQFKRHKLTERLLVLSQLQEEVPLMIPGSTNPQRQIVVNGQGSPKIIMQPGEVQRWRLVAAMMQQSSALRINFGNKVTVRQIAMDGVQFAEENYQLQPLLNEENEISLFPGNRADFLVKANDTPGTYKVGFELIAKNVRKHAPHIIEGLPLGEQDGDPAVEYQLFDIVVAGDSKEMAELNTIKMPKMPWYLETLPPSNEPARTISYQMTKRTFSKEDPPRFFINDVQYVPLAVDPNFVTQLDSIIDWNLVNVAPDQASLVQHPFHIHVNPFQVLNYPDNLEVKPDYGKNKKYVWQDTVPLSNKVGGIVKIRQKFLNFTGKYVQHCHILGHEDRGMMTNVMTVCPGADPNDSSTWKVGTPTPGGNECDHPQITNLIAMPSPDVVATLRELGGPDWLRLCQPSKYFPLKSNALELLQPNQ